jgi:stage III sporulation protein AA
LNAPDGTTWTYTAAFEKKDELLRIFLSARNGILVYSPPGEGKTSALRSLALGLGTMGMEVAVVDERCEFALEEYVGASVDILRGYRRAEGIEIALRTLSPDVIIVDEIGRLSEAEAMLESLSSGVRVAISAHASSADEVTRRRSLRPFIEVGAVDVLVGIKNVDGKRNITVLGVQ